MTRPQRIVRFVLDVLVGLLFYRRGFTEGRRYGESIGRLRGAVEVVSAQNEAKLRAPRSPSGPRFGRRS